MLGDGARIRGARLRRGRRMRHVPVLGVRARRRDPFVRHRCVVVHPACEPGELRPADGGPVALRPRGRLLLMIATSSVKRILLACLGGVLVLAAGCNTTTITGSGQVVSRSVSVSSFSHMRVDGAFEVTVSSGAKERVTLR